MNKLCSVCGVISVCFLTVFYCNAKNYYVKTNGNPALPASSWGWASNDLQAVINKATAGDVVYVATGKYYGSFIMKEGITVQGGYTANVNNPTERYTMTDADSSHYSVLDGQEKQRVLTQLIPYSTATVWDGFILRNGKPATTFKTGSIIYSQTGDNKIIGVLYQKDTETKTGSMIGTKELRKQWGGYENTIDELSPLIDRTNATKNTSGEENSAKIFNELNQNSVDFSSADYAENGNYAAYWCDTLTTGGYSGWYLPASGELQKVYEANILTTLKSIGKEMKYPYWTSGKVGNTMAWAYCFGNGYCHPALKYTPYVVSAVHTFTEPETPNGIYYAGGGAFLYTNGILKNCIITNNISSSKGGGIYCWAGQLIDCRVEENSAPVGKEIYYETISGINEINTQPVDVYPNPIKAGQNISILGPSTDNCNFSIANLSGQIIKSGKINAREALAAPVEKGIYIIHLQSKEVQLSKKIIIN